jgi:hypothetical protein
MKYLCFDIETAKAVPSVEELQAQSEAALAAGDWQEGARLSRLAEDRERLGWQPWWPLGISCAATIKSDDGDPILWHGVEEDGILASQMSPKEVAEMVKYMAMQSGLGYRVVGWNSLGFDLKAIHDELDDKAQQATVRQLAFHHCDPYFVQVCQFGYGISLNAAAEGLNVTGKTEGMSGDLAPVMWGQGREQQDLVLEYVAQDVISTAAVYEALFGTPGFKWITRKGTKSRSPWIPARNRYGVLLVEEALKLPQPNTSWMTNPRTRESYYEWANG